MLLSEPIVDEVVAVLGRPFFRHRRHIGEADLARVKRALETDAAMVSHKKRLRVVEDDPDDDRVLECALEGGADYLVSGDRRLLGIERYGGIRIVTPREFMAIPKEREARQ